MRIEYKFEAYKSGGKNRYNCPNCDQSKQFTRYVDPNGGYIADHVGICNRVNNCGYHLTPNEYYKLNPDQMKEFKKVTVKNDPKPIAASYISPVSLKNTLNQDNEFLQFLRGLFGPEITTELTKTYMIGSTKHYNKFFTVFWQIDKYKRIRTGKAISYDSSTGKRKKEQYSTNWMHRILNLKNFNLTQCLYGLQLIDTAKDKHIAIVESEKTAIIASIYLPQFIWMASGSLQMIKKDILSPLKGRKVVLFPDANCFELWCQKAAKVSLDTGINIKVSNFLHDNASKEDKATDIDIADYLIKYKVSDFKRKEPIQTDINFETQEVKQRVKEQEDITIAGDQITDSIEAESKFFIDESGTLYIRNPYSPKLTTYSSIEAYNNRSELPEFKTIKENLIKEFTSLELLEGLRLKKK